MAVIGISFVNFGNFISVHCYQKYIIKIRIIIFFIY